MTYLQHALYLVATAPTPPEKVSPFGPEFFIVLAIFLLASIFLIQRPKQKQEEAKKKALEGMKKGDKVVSIGGIHGSIVRMNKNRDTVVVSVAKGVEIEFSKSAVNVVKEGKGKEQKEEDEETDEKKDGAKK